MRKFLIPAIFLFCAAGSGVFAQTQSRFSLSGKVLDGMTLKPVPFAQIIVQEAGVVATGNQYGFYRVDIPKAGTYTVRIISPNLQPLTTPVTVKGSMVMDFTLNPFVSRGGGVTVRADRDIQRISRQTMTAKEIKEVPASFGDSISALTSLPGINRTGGFFGPLIIRGADSSMNGYYVDDIPLFKPMHFGGIHSVISSDLMDTIDTYSSAYPSQFSNAQAAVININTVDSVKKAGGHTDIGLISANAYFEAPITQDVITDGGSKEENKGYIIGAGRYGYLSLFIPFFYKHVMHQSLSWLPEYWDYQFKAKYSFNAHHAVSFLAFGNKDKIDLNLKDIPMDDGADPLMKGLQMYQNDQSFSQGGYYTYTYSDQLSNTVMSYAALNRSRLWMNVPDSTQSWSKDLGINSDPNIFGVKDKLRIEPWKSHDEIRAGVEATLYYFKTSGKTIKTTSDSEDLNGSGLVQIIPLGQTYINRTLSGFAENKFSYGGLQFVPGVHFEYLDKTSTTTIDPRGMISFTFPSDTTIGFAGGYYSAFLQTNPEYFTQLPNLAGEDLKPQRSIHRSASIEQKAGIFDLKAEGFYNTFTDIVIQDSYMDENDKVQAIYRNAGKIRTYGIELLVKIKEESDQGFFGWASYTFNRSKYEFNQSATYSPLYGRLWLNSPYDMPHVFKAVGGYTFGKHTLSSKVQYNSAAPYTPIVGSYSDDAYTAATGKPRIVPVNGKPYSARLDPEYRIDLRYSYKTQYRWGYISWYVEAIGIISSPQQEYKWDYRYQYSGNNPRIKKSNELSFIPNFGVEVKF